MKTFALAFALLASVNTFAQVVYTDSADLSTSTIGHSLVDAEYKLIPTKTTTRKIPGCVIHSENYPENCEEVVVLQSEPVVVVTVSYKDTMFASEGNELSYAFFNFKISDFDAAEVAALKAASPLWRHPFSNAGKRFAQKHFTLSVVRAERTIQVVDVRNSTICRELESGVIDTSCVENLVYKPATTFVKQVNLIQK
jgi:hypothetical protein